MAGSRRGPRSAPTAPLELLDRPADRERADTDQTDRRPHRVELELAGDHVILGDVEHEERDRHEPERMELSPQRAPPPERQRRRAIQTERGHERRGDAGPPAKLFAELLVEVFL